MRKTNALSPLCLLAALAAAAPAWAQEPALSRVADGGFESGVVSLALPAIERFPMVANGWASRGTRAPELIEGVDAAYEGMRAVRLATRTAEHLHLIQDLPLTGGGGYIVELALLYEAGAQTVSLLTAWDRGDPETGTPAFAATVSASGIDVETPDGRWHVERPLVRSQWHVLRIVADPRSQSQSVYLDGSQVLLVPGTAAATPRTLVIGSSGGVAGALRYDAIRAFSLIDVELEALRDAARLLEDPVRGWTLRRFDAAAAALSQSAPVLALPELDVARGLMASAMLPIDGQAADLRAAIAGYRLALHLGRGIEDLIALINAGRN